MSIVTHDIVANPRNSCDVFKGDGVTYLQYVTEWTYLLFLKMAQKTGTEPKTRSPRVAAGKTLRTRLHRTGST